MTKEEILSKHVNTQWYSRDECETIHHSLDVKNAMEEYAKYIATDFLRWVSENQPISVHDKDIASLSSGRKYDSYLKFR